MLTIENLEVQFDVEGSKDETTFARLFRHHMEQWARQEREARERTAQLESERDLGQSRRNG